MLGEEASGSGTVRTVDSSLERLQVKVSGFTDRYAVTCNARRIPLHPTGEPGQAVAGVRFRAWKPVSCLHPTIPVHAPLAFDVVDQWNQRSLGGCTYHVRHPAGRIYTARPVNAAEAESRRSERFQSSGHTPGPIIAPVEDPNPSFPMTLDLRWPGPVEKRAVCSAAFMIADLLQQASLRDPSVYDELSNDGINPRPHWAGLIESLRAIGSEELAKRWAKAERRIHENGVTYNVYGDALGENRPWRLDLIPLLIAADEWRYIEAGIVQRAQLLELMLADLYGPQKLVKDGHLPPALLFANPEFLRPVAGTQVSPRKLSTFDCGGSRALAGRPMVGARRPHTGSIGSGLCVGESHHCRGCSSGSFPRFKRAETGAILPRPTRGFDQPGGLRSSSHCAADARSLERNLLRAFVPGTVSRVHAGRRRQILPFATAAFT